MLRSDSSRNLLKRRIKHAKENKTCNIKDNWSKHKKRSANNDKKEGFRGKSKSKKISKENFSYRKRCKRYKLEERPVKSRT